MHSASLRLRLTIVVLLLIALCVVAVWYAEAAHYGLWHVVASGPDIINHSG